MKNCDICEYGQPTMWRMWRLNICASCENILFKIAYGVIEGDNLEELTDRLKQRYTNRGKNEV